MNRSTKVLWGEGLFLRPQHFQRQDAYHEARLHEMSDALHPYAWGVRNVRFDLDGLANGTLRATELSVILPDGDLYNAPESDELPAPIGLDSMPSDNGEITFYLAFAPLKDHGKNYASPEEAGLNARFVRSQSIANDWYTEAQSAEVTVLRKSARLLAETDPHTQYITVPVVRIRRTGTGAFELDTGFMPPCVSVRACPAMHLQLRRMLDILQAKVNAMYGFHREPNKHIIEFRSGDTASFWLLHTASSAYAALSHLFHHPGLHPERLFQQLLQLAGALLTFSKSFTLADLPVYQHADPGPGFAKLDAILRDLLETVISTRYFSIALSETKPSYWMGRLDSDKIDEQTRFYLSVSAQMPALELVDSIPRLVKIGGPDDVEQRVRGFLPGIKLTHAPQVPAAIPVRPGAYYFALDARDPLYERMLQQQSVMLFVSPDVLESKLELIAVTQ